VSVKNISRKDVPFYNKNSFVVFFLISIAVICTLSYVLASYLGLLTNDDSNINSSDNASPTMAIIICEDFVKERLIAPTTAKFPGVRDADIWTLGKESGKYENAFHVESYVDSQNSFGAMIRSFYTCDVNYVGNDEWKLLDLEIN
jgi:hypothetical protein